MPAQQLVTAYANPDPERPDRVGHTTALQLHGHPPRHDPRRDSVDTHRDDPRPPLWSRRGHTPQTDPHERTLFLLPAYTQDGRPVDSRAYAGGIAFARGKVGR